MACVFGVDNQKADIMVDTHKKGKHKKSTRFFRFSRGKIGAEGEKKKLCLV